MENSIGNYTLNYVKGGTIEITKLSTKETRTLLMDGNVVSENISLTFRKGRDS